MYLISCDYSAEDRREYLESLLRESKKEEAAPVLHDDAVNDLIARRYILKLRNIDTCFRFSFFFPVQYALPETFL